MKNRGFTLIELILVIAILGILAVSALPRFLDLTTEAEHVSRDGVVGAVRAGIALYRANDMVATGEAGSYPPSLDSLPDGTVCSDVARCFSAVTVNGVDDSKWQKINNTQYTFNDGTSVTTYTYNSSNGTFE